MFRILLELSALFFALSTIYRRIIQPFIEGMRGGRKSDGQPDVSQGRKFGGTAPKKNIKTVDPKEIQDAEFKEIK